MRYVLALCLLGTLTACGSASDHPKAKTADKPKTFFMPGTLRVDAVGFVHIDDNGGCTFEDMTSPYVVVTDPADKRVAKTPLSAGKAEALDGAKYYTPGICEFTFELTALPKADGVFEVAVDGGGPSATFTDTDTSVKIDWSN